MNRLTTFRSFNSCEKHSAPANLNAYLKRNIKTSTPVSHSFGRGYGIVPAKPIGSHFLLPDKDLSVPLMREMTVGKPKTKIEREIDEENLRPKNLKIRPAKENLDDIAQDLIKLTEKEIQSILDEDASSIQTERGKTWLEQSQFALRPVPDNKEMLVLTRKTGNTTVSVTFKKEYEEIAEEEDEAEEGNEGETEVAATEDTEAEVAKDQENEGQDWIRSGDELPDREDFPQKHSLEIDIRIQDKQGKPKGKLHLYGFAGLDDRLYVNEMLCENDVSVETEEKKTYCVFDDLSEVMQDRIYDYLDELGVDDRMAHFVKTTVVREKKESDIAFLTNFKEILKTN